MATFTVEITPDSSNGTIAHAVGKFSGGSSSYKGQRRMDVAVNGTAYEVMGGKCLVNGTVYNILKGRTLIGGTGYDINFEPDVSLTWYFNETIDITSQPDKFWGYSSGIAVSFVSGYYGFTYDHLIRGYDDTYGVRTLIYYRKITETMELAYRNGWRGEVYRTITFDELPTGDLLTWLQANATPQ